MGVRDLREDLGGVLGGEVVREGEGGEGGHGKVREVHVVVREDRDLGQRESGLVPCVDEGDSRVEGKMGSSCFLEQKHVEVFPCLFLALEDLEVQIQFLGARKKGLKEKMWKDLA